MLAVAVDPGSFLTKSRTRKNNWQSQYTEHDWLTYWDAKRQNQYHWGEESFHFVRSCWIWEAQIRSKPLETHLCRLFCDGLVTCVHAYGNLTPAHKTWIDWLINWMIDWLIDWLTPFWSLFVPQFCYIILLRVFPNRIYENDRELHMVAHWFAEEMTRARISTVWDKWPQAWRF